MVTKKIVVSPELRRKQLKEHPERIMYAYRRQNNIGVNCRIRYDPSYSTATLEDPMCATYTEEFYFLSKLHYEQLLFSLKCFSWGVRIEYQEFISILDNYFESSGLCPESCYIITMTVYKDGGVELQAEETTPIYNMFEGLLDHLRILHNDPVRTHAESETYIVTLKPMPVYIDTDFTLPSKYSLLDLNDRQIYDQAVTRVKQDYELDDQIALSPFQVLLWSTVQHVMSATDYIVAFYNEGKWYVPHASAGGRQDPLRMVLLEQGVVEEALFNVQRLSPGDDVLLISAQFGIRRGVLKGHLPEPLTRYSRSRQPKAGIVRKRTEMQIHDSEAAAKRSSESVRTSDEGAISGLPGTAILKFSSSKRRK